MKILPMVSQDRYNVNKIDKLAGISMSSSETWLSVERVRDDQKESTSLDCRLMKMCH